MITNADKLEVKQSALGYYRTMRNLYRSRGSVGRELAAAAEIDRLESEIKTIKREEAASNEAA